MKAKAIIFFFLLLSSCGDRDSTKIIMPDIIDLGYIEYQENVQMHHCNDSVASQKVVIKYKNLTKKRIQISTIEVDCNCLVLKDIDNTKFVAPFTCDSFYVYYHPQDFGYTEKRILVFFENFKEPKEILLKARIVQSATLK